MILLKAGGFEFVVVVGRRYHARSNLKSQIDRSDSVFNCL